MDDAFLRMSCPLCTRSHGLSHVDNTTVRCVHCGSLMPADWVRDRVAGAPVAWLDGTHPVEQLREMARWRYAKFQAHQSAAGAARAAACERTELGAFKKKAPATGL